MTLTKKRVIIAIAVALAVLLLWTTFGPTVQASERVITSKTPAGTTWRSPDPRGICSSGGNLRGWILRVGGYSPWPLHIHRWTYGDWSGSFCSNNSRIFSINWGGQPDGWVNTVEGWRWDANDSRIVDHDYTGDVQYRKWRGKFECCFHIPAQTDWPWLKVLLRPGQAPVMTNSAG